MLNTYFNIVHYRCSFLVLTFEFAIGFQNNHLITLRKQFASTNGKNRRICYLMTYSFKNINRLTNKLSSRLCFSCTVNFLNKKHLNRKLDVQYYT